MATENEKGLPQCDPVGATVVGITFLLLIAWFVWYLVSPPVLRVPPELRKEPIPPDYGLRERIPIPRSSPPLGGPQRPGPERGMPASPTTLPPRR
jgi:hypothetical protein